MVTFILFRPIGTKQKRATLHQSHQKISKVQGRKSVARRYQIEPHTQALTTQP